MDRFREILFGRVVERDILALLLTRTMVAPLLASALKDTSDPATNAFS